jgi:hypothetical protein
MHALLCLELAYTHQCWLQCKVENSFTSIFYFYQKCSSSSDGHILITITIISPHPLSKYNISLNLGGGGGFLYAPSGWWQHKFTHIKNRIRFFRNILQKIANHVLKANNHAEIRNLVMEVLSLNITRATNSGRIIWRHLDCVITVNFVTFYGYYK